MQKVTKRTKRTRKNNLNVATLMWLPSECKLQKVCTHKKWETESEWWVSVNEMSVSMIYASLTRTHPFQFNLTQFFASNVIIRFFNFAAAFSFSFLFFSGIFRMATWGAHSNRSYFTAADAHITVDIVHLPCTHVNLYQMIGMVSFDGGQYARYHHRAELFSI